MADDLIRVNDLSITVLLASGSRWPPKGTSPTSQPILVSIAIPHSVKSTAETDDLSNSINYSTLASTLRNSLGSNSTTSPPPSFESLEQLTSRAFDLLLSPKTLPGAELKVVQTKPPLHCKAVGIECNAIAGKDSPWRLCMLRHFIQDFECHPIIGVNPAERLERQLVRINVAIETPNANLTSRYRLDFRALIRRLYEKVNDTSYLTLEALASFIAQEVLQQLWSSTLRDKNSYPEVTIKAAKPCALVFADSSEVEIRRTFRDYQDQFSDKAEDMSPPLQLEDQRTLEGFHVVAIALGSNVGDSFQNIETALRLLELPLDVFADRETLSADAKITVINTSFLYKSAPMYVLDQPAFINCACLIETNLQPLALLRLVKRIEELVGRQPSFRNGPRAVDLDIVLYDDAVLDSRSVHDRGNLDNLSGHLIVPHPRMIEREFVLRPLYDMIPDYIHPVLHKSIDTLLKELLFVSDEPPMQRVIPFPRYPLLPNVAPVHPSIAPVPPTLCHWSHPQTQSTRKTQSNTKHKTYLMATLNATPDSFSDGSTNNTVPAALAYVQEAVQAKADIVDIGGYSTRPGAAFVSVEEETDRVVPIIAAIRAEGDVLVKDVPISVDTFRWEVARSAIIAGANCINDVYAFTGPDNWPYPPPKDSEEERKSDEYMSELRNVARKYAVPVVLMHSRGDAGKNKDYTEYEYAKDGPALEGVRVELGRKVDKAVKGKGGVRRWFVIADPGVGFSKTVEGNLEVIRLGSLITAEMYVGQGDKRRWNSLAGYPQLIGTSRKSFLGTILSSERGKSTEPKERNFATAAAVTSAVQQGALVVRVHDVHEMADVVAVADALWR